MTEPIELIGASSRCRQPEHARPLDEASSSKARKRTGGRFVQRTALILEALQESVVGESVDTSSRGGTANQTAKQATPSPQFSNASAAAWRGRKSQWPPTATLGA